MDDPQSVQRHGECANYDNEFENKFRVHCFIPWLLSLVDPQRGALGASKLVGAMARKIE